MNHPLSTTMQIHSFEPIAAPNSQLLILGSIPGQVSLSAGQYYAHPQNSFWSLLAELLGFDHALDYSDRVKMLQQARIALWDVLQSAQRNHSSLDTSILKHTEVPNDINGFIREHSGIQVIFFNGAKAASAFRWHILATMPDKRPITYHQLPSTSPAHASMSYTDKLKQWRTILQVR